MARARGDVISPAARKGRKAGIEGGGNPAFAERGGRRSGSGGDGRAWFGPGLKNLKPEVFWPAHVTTLFASTVLIPKSTIGLLMFVGSTELQVTMFFEPLLMAIPVVA